MKRIKIKWRKPNPLFEMWIEEWMNEAKKKNSDLQYNFSKALGSLRKYPLPLKSGKDCMILQNFGEKLCSMLDKKLERYKIDSEDSISVDQDYNCVSCSNSLEQENPHRRKCDRQKQSALGSKQRRECTDCFPDNLCKLSSRTYDVESVESTSSKKCEINGINEDTKRLKVDDCSENTIKPQEKKNRKKNTKNGTSSKVTKEKNDLVDDLVNEIYLDSKNFDIILLVDTQETCGGKTKPQHDATIVELTELGVLFEVRHLKVGDFAWIARCRSTRNELVLPYIVERKRIDDLSASIIDGRFYEQKFRLKQSGIENLMYIVEEYEKNHRSSIPHSSLLQASINSIVQDGFSLKYTESHKSSMFYLSSLTRILIRTYGSKNLIGCKKKDLVPIGSLSIDSIRLMKFDEFNKAASKQKVFKVNEMFVRQLLQLKGISVDKAITIVKHYPTPRILMDALRESACNGELLLANIQFGEKKRLGPVISKTVYQLYTKRALI